jgi:hypothetical protein
MHTLAKSNKYLSCPQDSLSPAVDSFSNIEPWLTESLHTTPHLAGIISCIYKFADAELDICLRSDESPRVDAYAGLVSDLLDAMSTFICATDRLTEGCE